MSNNSGDAGDKEAMRAAEDSLKEEGAVENVEHFLSCDLVAQSQLHVLFLQTIHKTGVSLARPSGESFRRYAHLWLPLLHVHQKKKIRATLCNDSPLAVGLVPPPDIAWLWHCHRLAPFRYTQHIRERFKVEPFEAEPPFAVQHTGTSKRSRLQAEINTQILWKELYPDEPFFLDTEHRVNREEYIHDGMLSGFNVLDSAERQSSFLWQVSGPRFNDTGFLQQGVLNYFRFLSLKCTEKGRTQIIVPTYQIDLMWHTHILSSLKDYNADCISIMGQALNHDDSLNDRSENSDLNIAFRETKQLWKSIYGVDYTVPGGMYRGEPPESYFAAAFWKDVFQDAPTGPFMHLIGKVGASSTGKPSDHSPFREAREWTDLDAPACPDGKPPFMEAKARSTTRGENSNPETKDYIFGRGPKGFGFYHTTTREAYEILLVRITKRVQAKQGAISCYGCLACMCPCFSCALSKKQTLENDLAELEALQSLVRARSEADVPHGVVGIPEDMTQEEGGTEATTGLRRNYYYTVGGIWLFPEELREAGGGCGAVVDGAGGCGTSGCAAGGCGGAGCGAGGCGGGGCGGG